MFTRKLTIIASIVLLVLLAVSRGSIAMVEAASKDFTSNASGESSAELRQGPIRVGEIEPMDLNITYLNEAGWTQTIRYPEATYIKVHFAKLDLLPDDYVTVSDPAGIQVYTYPNVSEYTTDEGEGFWAISVIGDTAIVELHSRHEGETLSDEELQQLGVVIDKYGRGYPLQLFESTPSPQDVCDTDQRTDVACYRSSHPAEYNRAKAVARMMRPIGGGYYEGCTVWRVGPNNRLFTNEHCITDQAQLNASEFWFDYQRPYCGSGNPATIIVTGDVFLVDDYTLDFALFTVKNFSRISGFGYLELDVRTPVQNEEIYIPQHGDDNPKQLGIESELNVGNVCRIDDAVANGRGTDTDTGYHCDTSGGSSGSPVLARSSHRVIALHHWGLAEGFSCPSDGMNQGVRMDRIWPLVQPYLESTLVKVTITRFEEIDDPDPGFFQGPHGDYYTHIDIDDKPFENRDAHTQDTSTIEPNWTFHAIVDRALKSIPVTIRILDADLDGGDDEMDVNPAPGENVLDLTLDLNTGDWTGDIPRNQHFSRGDGADNGKVFFDISVEKPATSCQIDLQNNTHTCSDPAITFIEGPSNGEAVLKINLDPQVSGYTKAVFDVEYGAPPSGWTVNIGDSVTNNGAGGDCATQSNDAELHIQNATMKIFGKDGTPVNPLLTVSDFVSDDSLVTLAISNERLDWDNHSSKAGKLVSPYLYALHGQLDSEGPVNYDIYAAFNRVITLNGCPPEARRGSGVTHVTVKLLAEPTAVTLTSFTASADTDRVTLAWETASETDNEGFNLWRSQAADGAYTKLNAALIPAEGNADTGASYDYTDADVVRGVTYYYKLEDVDLHGVSAFHGPVSATPGQARIYLPLVFK